MPTVPTPYTLQQFIATLSGSGVLSAGEMRSFVDNLSPELRAGDVRTLTNELVRQNKLTPFQAKLVCSGKTDRLVFGDYVLLEKIGAGGMGQVFKARNRRMDRVVALKLLPLRGAKSPVAVARFQREVKVTARLDHPNIVAAYHAGVVAQNHFLETQFIDGPDLKTLVDWNGPLSVGDALSFTLQAARGLHHAHQQGVIHRDIKPANLLIDRSTNILKILDWGLARIVGEEADTSDESSSGRLTLPDQLLGTADYMSPEQSEETHQADVPSDIYSLGCTLCYLLTGAPPFEGETVYQVLVAHRTAPTPRLRAHRDDVPEQLDGLFRTMMAKHAGDRCQSMAEVIAPLETILEAITSSPSAACGSAGGDSRPGVPGAGSASNERRLPETMAFTFPPAGEPGSGSRNSAGNASSRVTDKTQVTERDLTTAEESGITMAYNELPSSDQMSASRAGQSAPNRPAATDETRLHSITEDTAPDEADSEAGLRQFVGQTVGLQSGFASLLRNDGKSSIWFNYQGAKVPQYHLRQRTAGQVLEWETPPVVIDSRTRRAIFVFAGALGSISEPQTEGFTFLINNLEVVDFDLARKETCWQSQEHNVAMLFSPRWTSEEDTAGFFYVSVPENLVTPGDPCRLAVRNKGSGSRRWFSLYPTPDVVKLQAETPPNGTRTSR